MPSCFICGRSKTAKSKSENISFHRFPSKEHILKKWHGFILSHDLAVDKINKSSLICSLHFVPESFIVQNKFKLLQKHAMPTIKISRVKWAKIEYPELKEKLSLAEHSSSTSKLIMEKILVKGSYSYDPSQSVAPTIDLDLTASTSETLSLCKPTVKVPNISEIPEGFVPLANLDQTMACTSSESETLSLYTHTVRVPNISEIPEGFAPLANLDRIIVSTSSGSETLSLCTPTVRKKFKSSFLAANYASPNDTPRRSYLKHGIHTLSDEILKKNKKIKGLQQIIRRKNKQIASLSEIICKLKNNNLSTEEDTNTTILLESFGNNERMEEYIDNINDDNDANVCNDNVMLNNYLNGDFMDTTKQNVNTTPHDHNYCITTKGLMNEKYDDINRSIFNDASTDQLDKDVSLPTLDQPEKTSITITNVQKSVLKNFTNILTTIGVPKKKRIMQTSCF